MNVFLLIAAAIILIVVLLRFKCPIGPAILAGGALLWLFEDPTLRALTEAGHDMLTMNRTYDLLFALYFVMCLEIQLRRSGTLKGMVDALNRFFSSTKVVISSMPAFLGLLPSVGGARFSAPIVETACEGMDIKPESKAAINFWFRHICEFASPIIPGMILGCAIAHVSVADLVIHLFWMSVVAFATGWFVMVRPLKFEEKRRKGRTVVRAAQDRPHQRRARHRARASERRSHDGLQPLRRPRHGRRGRAAHPRTSDDEARRERQDVFVGAADWRLLLNVGCILFFIQLLEATGILHQIITCFEGSALPVPVIIALTSFVIGILTGMSQGHVAIVMPIVAGLMPGSLDLAGVAMVFGVAGQMITPTHVCLTITIDYFKSDFFKTLVPVILAEAIVLVVFSAWTWLTWTA
ncbi:MAG: DUF401 family protein [Sutterella wadsworthensis]